MSEGSSPSAMSRRGAALASGASDHLTVVSRRNASPRGRPDEGLLSLLESALLQPDRSARTEAVSRMIESGLCWDEIVDDYIPAAARRMGDLWCEDEVGFADVTIATARLQSMLRDMAPGWAAERADDPAAPNVLLVVREDDYHTLGAMVAAAQLRRIGLSVRLSLGLPAAEVARLVAEKRFDAILVSASAGENLDSLRKLVKIMRQALVSPTPIVVGGTILESDRDVKACTGADHATCDPNEVLRLCGLKISLPADAPPMDGG